MGAGVFVAVCGFLVAGLVNDSTVQVMPVFMLYWEQVLQLTEF